MVNSQLKLPVQLGAWCDAALQCRLSHFSNCSGKPTLFVTCCKPLPYL